MNFLKIFTARAQGQGRKNSRSFPNGTAKVDIIFELTNFFGDFFKKNVFFERAKKVRQ